MRHLLMPQTEEQAREFLRLAIVEAGRFGVRPPQAPMPHIVFPSDADRAENEELDRMCGHLEDLLGSAPQWLTVDEFQATGYEGWCWISYKGRVTEAYHNHKGEFRFHSLSQNVFMTECIRAVMHWPCPEGPGDLGGR